MSEETTASPASDALFFLHTRNADIGPASDPTEVAGVPARAFWGNAIKMGERYQTLDRRTGKMVELSATPERVDGWLKNFERLKAKGIRVPLCPDHSVKTMHVLGKTLDARRSGDWLQVKVLAIGNDAILAAARNEISLGITPAFSDGQGEAFGETITHVSLTPEPVVPGQGDLIAASRGGDGEALVYTLSAADHQEPLPERSTDMPLPDDIRQRLLVHAREPGATPNPAEEAKIPDDVLLSRVLDEADAMRKDVLNLSAQKDHFEGELTLSRESLAETEAAKEAAERERDEAKAATVNLSREHAAPDELQLSMYAENFDGAREQAIKAGVPLPVADAFTQMLRDASGAPGTIALSLAGTGNDRRPFEFKFWRTLIAAFAGNPIVVGTKMPEGAKRVTTTMQKVNLSRGESGELDESVISQWDKEDESLKQRELASAAAR